MSSIRRALSKIRVVSCCDDQNRRNRDESATIFSVHFYIKTSNRRRIPISSPSKRRLKITCISVGSSRRFSYTRVEQFFIKDVEIGIEMKESEATNVENG